MRRGHAQACRRCRDLKGLLRGYKGMKGVLRELQRHEEGCAEGVHMHKEQGHTRCWVRTLWLGLLPMSGRAAGRDSRGRKGGLARLGLCTLRCQGGCRRVVHIEIPGGAGGIYRDH